MQSDAQKFSAVVVTTDGQLHNSTHHMNRRIVQLAAVFSRKIFVQGESDWWITRFRFQDLKIGTWLGLSLAFYAGGASRLISMGGLLALFRRRGGEGQQENQGSRITDQDRAVLVKTVQYLLFFRMGKTCKVCGRKFGLVKSDAERRVFSSWLLVCMLASVHELMIFHRPDSPHVAS